MKTKTNFVSLRLSNAAVTLPLALRACRRACAVGLCLLSLGGLTLPLERAAAADAPAAQIYNLKELDSIPVVRYQAKPVYPFALRSAGITGEVVVAFIVEADGEVHAVEAVRSTQKEFESAAVEAVSKWKFKAGKKDGRTVATRMQVPIKFSITAIKEKK
ncbi:MAG: energy transducer TonB [Opitutae bacterium]|nr:energy transducer TonB [Opitutae bacterium]